MSPRSQRAAEKKLGELERGGFPRGEGGKFFERISVSHHEEFTSTRESAKTHEFDSRVLNEEPCRLRGHIKLVKVCVNGYFLTFEI